MFAPVPQGVPPVLQVKKRRYEGECDSSTESEDILFFGEDAAVLHTRPRKMRRLRGSVPPKASPVQVPLATLASTSLHRGSSASSEMEGVVNASLVALHLHGQTPADTNTSEQTSRDWWFQDGDVVLAAGSMLFKVHSTVLAAGSGVFADLFALGRPEASTEGEEASNGGAPTIPVHDDANDWLVVLPWLYYGL
jgi:BTB/POZ domain